MRNTLTSPEPEAYEGTLPVHQDGTCNGLQHYAALGGDVQGVAQVNLAVADRPSDVYTYVARMVEDTIKKDLEDNNEIARFLSGKVVRKVVKQTVHFVLSFCCVDADDRGVGHGHGVRRHVRRCMSAD